MVLRFACVFDAIPEFWLNMQRAVDLYEALEERRDEYERIKPLTIKQQASTSGARVAINLQVAVCAPFSILRLLMPMAHKLKVAPQLRPVPPLPPPVILLVPVLLWHVVAA